MSNFYQMVEKSEMKVEICYITRGKSQHLDKRGGPQGPVPPWNFQALVLNIAMCPPGILKIT